MSKHNYSQYSNKANKPATSNTHEIEDDVVVVAEPETVEAPAVKMEVEAPKPVKTTKPKVVPETVEGTVVNCAKLNVRNKPSLDGDVVCVLNATSEINIDVAKSTREWFYVCTATGVEGYCMKKFIEANL